MIQGIDYTIDQGRSLKCVVWADVIAQDFAGIAQRARHHRRCASA
jgi:hypothetical protein